jgi:hypothetical protein
MAKRCCVAAFIAVALLGGCSGGNMSSTNPYPPVPAALTEPRPKPPATGDALLWQPGHWDWNGTGYVWQPGQYVTATGHGASWQSGWWSYSPSAGWVWQPAHWRS